MSRERGPKSHSSGGKSGRRPGRGARPAQGFQAKRDNGQWLVGRHAVEETLRSPKVKVLTVFFLTSDRRKNAELERLARRAGAKVQMVSRSDLDRVANGVSHQGMAVRVLEKKGVGLEEFVATLSEEKKKSTVLVALDQIQDPHNVGAIARSAACLGAAGIIFPDRRSSPITPTVVQVSAGAVQRIRTFQIGNLAQSLDKLKLQGFWVYGADREGQSLFKARLNTPMVLVIGSEGRGIRPLVKQKCDEIIAIPQSAGGIDSLNASCAASVLLYEAARQRHG